MRFVAVKQLAISLNVTPRRVHQLVHEGMPQAERGQYDLVACLEWYVRFLQRAVERRESLSGKSTTEDVRRERARLLQAQAEKIERQNAQRRGELVPIHVFTEMMAGMIATARAHFLNLPGRIAARLEGEPVHIIRGLIAEEVNSSLRALAMPGGHRDAPLANICLGAAESAVLGQLPPKVAPQ